MTAGLGWDGQGKAGQARRRQGPGMFYTLAAEPRRIVYERVYHAPWLLGLS